MKISEIFTLGKSQFELDFVDIDIKKDKRLFLDPHFIANRNDEWSREATLQIQSFFFNVLQSIRRGNLQEAKELFEPMHEPNETCLGLSRGEPDGRGVGKKNIEGIIRNILGSKAVKSGLVADLEDFHIFIDNFGKDKLSDMTTYIIKKSLIEYTKGQCLLHGIPLFTAPTGSFWDRDARSWKNEFDSMLIIGERRILLVPKAVVSFCKDYTPYVYYQHFALNFLQNEHLRLNSALVKTIKRKKKLIKIVTKKSLKDVGNTLSKEWLTDFSERHPGVFRNFKEARALPSKSLSDLQIISDKKADALYIKVIDHLIKTLQSITVGRNKAHEYHRLVIGILELIFYPKLINPIKERDINEGRKRIDISMENAAASGFFTHTGNKYQLVNPFVFIECKNYTNDPSNPELDQLAGRLSNNKTQVGMLFCRSIQDKILLNMRCQDSYRDDNKLMIPFEDDDLINILEHRKVGDDVLEAILAEKVSKIILG